MNWFLFISILGIAESLRLPINDLTSSWPPFSAWLLHQWLWLGRGGQHTGSSRGYLCETAAEDRAVNTEFEIAWEPGKRAWAEDSINAATLLSLCSCVDFPAELHGHKGCVYTGKQRQGLVMAPKSSGIGCPVFTLLQKTPRLCPYCLAWLMQHFSGPRHYH